jgi:L-fuculose-phosphate aldolase
MTHFKIAHEIVDVCKMLHDRNMLAACDGNVSYRISDSEILITPTAVHKAKINPAEMAVMTLDNKILKGNPSSERLLHLEVYRRSPDARCVVHAHPPMSIAWSISHPDLRELPVQSMSEAIIAVGRIPIVPYVEPGTEAMAKSIAPYLPDHKVMILGRHGVVCWGDTLSEAYNGVDRVEHVALILSHALSLGGITSLPDYELDKLYALRKKIGNRTL